MENIQLGLLLMVVGMTTVFVILFIVIYLGKGLIAFVNKYVPEVVIKKQVSASKPGDISVQDTVAIVSAVSAITGGAGKVIKIEKK